MTNPSVLLIGLDYFPFRHINEKNYWHSLLPLLAERLGADVPILSVNRRPQRVERQGEASPGVVIYNVPPAALTGAPPHPGFEAWPYLHHFPIGPLRRSLSLRRQLPMLDQLVERHRVGAIHFMDNFGDAMGTVKRRYPEATVTASLPTWMDRLGRLRPIYHAIRRRSFAELDAVITSSPATRRKMLAAGFPPGQVRVIPWAIVPGTGRRPAARARGRQLLGVPAEAPLLLWSGFTQRSTPDDLRFAVALAREAQRQLPSLYAAFAFKPADLRPEYEAYADARTVLRRTEQRTFRDVLAAGDLFVSPVTEPGRTVTPPLTWLEAMDAGMPVVTTPADGAADVIEDGVQGLIVPGEAEGGRRAAALLADRARLGTMRKAARALVAQRFDLRQVVTSYARLWRLDAGANPGARAETPAGTTVGPRRQSRARADEVLMSAEGGVS